MRGAGHVEEKPIAAPAGPIARLAPWLPTKCPAACPQHTLFFERSAMSLRTRNLTQRNGRRKVPEKRCSRLKALQSITSGSPEVGAWTLSRHVVQIAFLSHVH